MKNPSKISAGPLILIVIGLVLIGGAAGYLIYSINQANQDAGQVAPTLPAANRIPYPTIKRASLVDALAASQSGAAVFLDVRGRQYFDQLHIAGALSIPEDELPERIKELNPSDWIIPYCT